MCWSAIRWTRTPITVDHAIGGHLVERITNVLPGNGKVEVPDEHCANPGAVLVAAHLECLYEIHGLLLEANLIAKLVSWRIIGGRPAELRDPDLPIAMAAFNHCGPYVFNPPEVELAAAASIQVGENKGEHEENK